MKKLKTGHYLLGAFILLVGLLIVMNVLNDKKAGIYGTTRCGSSGNDY